ncbi:MAG: hypothetical protein H0X30_38775 [Anaerolineae bacterium]|nr:hypothetical protein [Anaerolineae bacterium]
MTTDMNRKRRLWIIISVGIIITLLVGVFAFRLMLNCCAPIQSTELTANSSDPVNKTTVALLNQTQTAAVEGTANLIEFRNDNWQPAKAYETQTAAYFVGLTLTSEPKTMTAIVGITETYVLANVMTQVYLSGAIYVPTPTATS